MRNNPRVPLEATEQTMLFRWAKLSEHAHPELRLLYHTPNGGSRNLAEAHNLRLQGVKPGVPDICLPVARGGYHGLYIELKRIQGGGLSDDQRGWLHCLNANGYKAVMCRGWLAAKEEIEKYLEGNKDE